MTKLGLAAQMADPRGDTWLHPFDVSIGHRGRDTGRLSRAIALYPVPKPFLDCAPGGDNGLADIFAVPGEQALGLFAGLAFDADEVEIIDIRPPTALLTRASRAVNRAVTAAVTRGNGLRIS